MFASIRRVFRVITLALFTFLALGGPTISGSGPWTSEHVVLASATDWNLYTMPAWARSCLYHNEDTSGTAYLGRYDQTGAFNATTSEYSTLPAGAALCRDLSQGSSTAPADHLVVPIASATASLPVGIECSANPCR